MKGKLRCGLEGRRIMIRFSAGQGARSFLERSDRLWVSQNLSALGGGGFFLWGKAIRARSWLTICIYRQCAVLHIRGFHMPSERCTLLNTRTNVPLLLFVYWRLESSGMWCCVLGWVVSNISKGRRAFVFRVTQSMKRSNLGLKYCHWLKHFTVFAYVMFLLKEHKWEFLHLPAHSFIYFHILWLSTKRWMDRVWSWSGNRSSSMLLFCVESVQNFVFNGLPR
jgi:hypothetical protein